MSLFEKGPIRVVQCKMAFEEFEGLLLPNNFEYTLNEGADALGRMFHDFLKDNTQEELWAVYFVTGKLAAVSRVGLGSQRLVTLDGRTIVRQAIGINATELVLIHLHVLPGAEPVAQDAAVTKRLAETLHTVDVQLLDHILINADGWQRMTDVFPNCVSVDRYVDPCIRADDTPNLTNPGNLLQEMLSNLLGAKALANFVIDFGTPESEERDTKKIIADLQKIQGDMKEGDGPIALAGPGKVGLIRITADTDIEDLVRNRVVPAMRNEIPQASIADELNSD